MKQDMLHYREAEFNSARDYSNYHCSSGDHRTINIVTELMHVLSQSESFEDDAYLTHVEAISDELLKNTSSSDVNFKFVKQLRKLTNSYKHVMEEFSSKLEKWAEMREKNIQNLQNSVQTFSFLKRSTAGITLVSSTMEFLIGFGSLLHKMIQLSPRYSLVMHALSGLSITWSFSTLMYSNQTMEDIVKDIRDEKYLIRDLETIYRRGNWIDKDVQDLFPHGIDLEAVNKRLISADGNLVESWKVRLLISIIRSNVEKDAKLVKDENFLVSVKEFVDSSAAHIWINRIRLRYILDVMTKKLENFQDKKSINVNSSFLNLAAMNLFPVFCPIFLDSRKTNEIKFLLNSLVAISSGFCFSEEDGEFEDIRETTVELKKDYKSIRRITKKLFSEYD